MIGLGGDCTLTYTGGGEVTDRVMDLAGKQQTVTFDQSGSGLLKFTSPFDISGYGFNKTIVLTGSTAGTGEFAGNIKNPYDRKGLARTLLTKTGTGTWTLSGSNSFSGPTTVAQGTLSLASTESLGPKTEVIIASRATLELNFNGRMKVRGLCLGGEVQPPGEYRAVRDRQVHGRNRDSDCRTITSCRQLPTEGCPLVSHTLTGYPEKLEAIWKVCPVIWVIEARCASEEAAFRAV